MERLTIPALGRLGERVFWELRRVGGRVARRVGLWGIAGAFLLTAVVVLFGVWLANRQQLLDAIQQRSELAQATERMAMTLNSSALPNARERLARFESSLVAHDDIPSVIEDMLRRAEDEGLSIQHGDYRPQTDTQGGFLRYRMSLPVTGEPGAIHRFIQAALLAHRSLALQSIHFGRERLESGHIEARLQWSLLTRLPLGGESPVPEGVKR